LLDRRQWVHFSIRRNKTMAQPNRVHMSRCWMSIVRAKSETV
jgi:hypothetical protein